MSKIYSFLGKLIAAGLCCSVLSMALAAQSIDELLQNIKPIGTVETDKNAPTITKPGAAANPSVSTATTPAGTTNTTAPASTGTVTSQALSAKNQASGSSGEGQKIYQTKWFACHQTGAAGAPKLGDAAAWSPRAKQGMDTLFNHTKNGFNAMPPKGTCTDCTDDQLKAAINYMLSQTLDTDKAVKKP